MPGTEAALSARIDELEVRQAYQDDLLRQLDEVLRQTADLARALELELHKMRQEVDRLGHAGPSALGDEVPPHY
jgi:uncharacterized coiled-coil protein SlyX